MTAKAITGAQILTDGIWLDDHALLAKDGRIEAIVAASAIPTDADVDWLSGGMLVAGFIDTQVNGGGGVLFNDEPNVKGIAAIAAAHRRFGTTAMLPTLISDDFEVIAAAIAAVEEAIASGVPGIIGIHIEGPFLNADKRGIHDSAKFRTLDEHAITLLSSLKNGRTLVTLAPELAPKGAIAALVEVGVIVAAGHTLATYEDMQRGISEGLSGVTHLFNAMSQLESRAPGVVGAALDSDLVCGIIVDGHHVHPASLRAAYQAKGADGLMLVTDAMPTVGSTKNHFHIGDTKIVAENGMLRSSDGTLAGSDLDMCSAIRNCVSMMRVDLTTAFQMASQTPASFLGLGADFGRIAPGYRADLVHLNDDLQVQATWIAGEMLQTQ
jgi:N-acetylglucosamine-6-phosphate deacetylase